MCPSSVLSSCDSLSLSLCHVRSTFQLDFQKSSCSVPFPNGLFRQKELVLVVHRFRSFLFFPVLWFFILRFFVTHHVRSCDFSLFPVLFFFDSSANRLVSRLFPSCSPPVSGLPSEFHHFIQPTGYRQLLFCCRRTRNPREDFLRFFICLLRHSRCP